MTARRTGRTAPDSPFGPLGWTHVTTCAPPMRSYSMATQLQPSSSKRRAPGRRMVPSRFSVRQMLLAIAVLSVPLAVIGAKVRWYQRQQAVLAQLEPYNARAVFEGPHL